MYPDFHEALRWKKIVLLMFDNKLLRYFSKINAMRGIGRMIIIGISTRFAVIFVTEI